MGQVFTLHVVGKWNIVQARMLHRKLTKFIARGWQLPKVQKGTSFSTEIGLYAGPITIANRRKLSRINIK